MKKKNIIALFAIAMVAMLGITPALAFRGDAFGRGPMSGPLQVDLSEEEIAEIQETHQAIREAIESGDYEAWQELMAARLTEERFEQLAEMHAQRSENMDARADLMQQLRDAREDGDEELTEELLEQLREFGGGFRSPGRGCKGFGGMLHGK